MVRTAVRRASSVLYILDVVQKDQKTIALVFEIREITTKIFQPFVVNFDQISSLRTFVGNHHAQYSLAFAWKFPNGLVADIDLLDQGNEIVGCGQVGQRLVVLWGVVVCDWAEIQLETAAIR